MGMDISPVDLINIDMFAARVIALTNYRKVGLSMCTKLRLGCDILVLLRTSCFQTITKKGGWTQWTLVYIIMGGGYILNCDVVGLLNTVSFKQEQRLYTKV